MERQLLGTDIEKCRECRGHVVQAGEEFVCTSCGVVARKVEEEKFHMQIHIRAPSQLSNGLGSFVGDRSDKDSSADFNGLCTIGFAKLLSDNMGVDQAAWHCKSTIRRVADRLSVPAFVRDNAMALSEKMLANSRANGRNGHRTSTPAISAYALLLACRAAGMDHVGSRDILRAHNELGRRVTRSALLRTVLGRLESNEGVLNRLKRRGAEPGPYFRRLLQASQTILGTLRSTKEGRNPRTIAAGSVYLAAKEAWFKAFTQKEVAEIVGVGEYTIREFVAGVNHEPGSLNPVRP